MEFKQGMPPKEDKKEQEVILLKKEIAELLKDSPEGAGEIKKDKLFKYIEMAINNPAFFQQEQDNISLITQYFLNEEDFVDEVFNEGDPEEKAILDKRIKDFELRKDGYLDFLRSKYSIGNFSKKIIILSLLTQAYAKAPFFNNFNSRNGIFSLVKKFSETENDAKGNYFLAQYLQALFSKEERNFSPASLISKDIYSYYLDDKLFISNEKNKQEIDLLLTEIKQDDLEFSLLEKNFGTNNEKLNILTQKRNKNYDKLESFFKPAEFKDISNLNPSLINEEKNMVDFMNYSIFLNPKVRKFFEEDFSVSLNNLSIKEQFRVIEYLKDNSFSEIKKSINFSKKYKENGLRTFLSIEQGGTKMGDKILELGENKKLPKEITRKVFTKYGEIVDKANNTEEEIRKIFNNENISERVLSSVKETLLKRGAKMLSDLGDKVMNEKFEVNEQEILDELDEIKEETIILGESCAKLYREGIKVPIEDITKIEEISVLKLTDKEKKELIKVYVNGRPKVTYENPDHLKMLEKEFEQELNSEGTSVFNIRFNGDIIIFAIVDKKDKDTLYIGGLTFVDGVRNPAVAEASMNLVLERFKNYNIRALVDSKNSILTMYQKRFGFNIVGELPKEENAGQIYYEIERPKEKEGRQIEKENELEKAA
jgi:hypothetical protein